jgi:hypothetical protein
VDPRRLLDEERECWERFVAALSAVDPSRRDERTVTPDGWSAKDSAFHVAWWLDECGRVLEAIGEGRPVPEDDARLDERNASHAERARAMGWDAVLAALDEGRARMRAAFAVLPAVGADAWSWFEESGPMHYAKHTHDLRAWASGVASDPEVGGLLGREQVAWVGFARALDAVPAPRQPGPDGWAAVDVATHLAAWVATAADAVGRNRDWTDASGPARAAVIERRNAALLAAPVDWLETRVALDAARARLRDGLAALPAPSAAAKRMFRANTFEHYEEHLAQLAALREAGEVAG